MLDIKNFVMAIEQLAEEKGISKDKILETIEMALAAAYKKDYGEKSQIIRSKFDLATGDASFWQVKTILDKDMIKSEEEIAEEEELRAKGIEQESSPEDEDDGAPRKVRFNPERHMMIDEAKKVKKDVTAGEELTFPLDTHDDYGRIAAQTAKQVILQRLREAEREVQFEHYSKQLGEIVSGVIQAVGPQGVTLGMDMKAEGIMPRRRPSAFSIP